MGPQQKKNERILKRKSKKYRHKVSRMLMKFDVERVLEGRSYRTCSDDTYVTLFSEDHDIKRQRSRKNGDKRLAYDRLSKVLDLF